VLRGATVVATGPEVASALRVRAPFAGTGVSVDLANTVLHATDTAAPSADTDIRLDSGAGDESVTATHSAFADVVNLGGGIVGAPGSGTNLAGAPAFADEAAEDFAPAAGSALVDAGSATWVDGPLDVAGGPRIMDGDGDCTAAPDIGAFERAAAKCAAGDDPAQPPATPQEPDPAEPSDPAEPAGPPPAVPSGAAAPTPDVTAPLLRGLRIARRTVRIGRRGGAPLPAVRFSLSEPAAVRLVVQRRRGRRWTTLRSFAVPAARAASGRIAPQRLRRAVRGLHRYVLVAKDGAGNASSPTTIRFRTV
jgi:hypothetical protein